MDIDEHKTIPADHEIVQNHDMGRYAGRRISTDAWIGGGEYGFPTRREAITAIWEHGSVAQPSRPL